MILGSVFPGWPLLCHPLHTVLAEERGVGVQVQVLAPQDPDRDQDRGSPLRGPHARVQADVRRISIGGRGKRIRLLLLQSARASERAREREESRSADRPAREWEEGTWTSGQQAPAAFSTTSPR